MKARPGVSRETSELSLICRQAVRTDKRMELSHQFSSHFNAELSHRPAVAQALPASIFAGFMLTVRESA